MIISEKDIPSIAPTLKVFSDDMKAYSYVSLVRATVEFQAYLLQIFN